MEKDKVEEAFNKWKEAAYAAFEGDLNTHLDRLWEEYMRARLEKKYEDYDDNLKGFYD